MTSQGRPLTLPRERQHYNPVAHRWMPCTATSRPCPYGKDAHRTVGGKASFFAEILAHLNLRDGQAELDRIMADDSGRLSVTCLDNTGAKEPSRYPFGDLVTDADLAARLHLADPHKQYQNDDCGVLANELWTFNPHVREYYVLKAPQDPDPFGIHQFVQLTDGTCADSQGIWTETALLKHWHGIQPGLTICLFDDGEPIPDRDLETQISNPALFDAVNETIRRHMASRA